MRRDDARPLSSWFARGHVIMSPQKGDYETSGSGDQRLFSFYRAVHIATMAELARLCIFPACTPPNSHSHSATWGRRSGHPPNYSPPGAVAGYPVHRRQT